MEAAKVRTYKKAQDNIVDLVHQPAGSQPCRLAHITVGAPGGLPVLQSRAVDKLDISEEIVIDTAVSFAIKIGPGALCIVVVDIVAVPTFCGF